ncbi:hypothetical protein DAEQUDRAFT_764362 [Daedalea quercina L-15889]|uniref:Uncharacterized protein n=1 Tax=Daedalea quercina L-15889 TaxID=1314783 RepID=A0A165RIF3_9APHY|nr:hypothetical protein DAEQUDRAFT_764362 [Daedalea quercina L-15889]
MVPVMVEDPPIVSVYETPPRRLDISELIMHLIFCHLSNPAASFLLPRPFLARHGCRPRLSFSSIAPPPLIHSSFDHPISVKLSEQHQHSLPLACYVHKVNELRGVLPPVPEKPASSPCCLLFDVSVLFRDQLSPALSTEDLDLSLSSRTIAEGPESQLGYTQTDMADISAAACVSTVSLSSASASILAWLPFLRLLRSPRSCTALSLVFPAL